MSMHAHKGVCVFSLVNWAVANSGHSEGRRRQRVERTQTNYIVRTKEGLEVSTEEYR